MSQMLLVTEYRTRPGKREELFAAFEKLVSQPRAGGQDFVVWSNSATERDASYLFEYWSEAERYSDLYDFPWYLEYITSVDGLIESPPTTTVTIPRLVEGV